jgi:leucyl aminopeptidase
MKGILTIGAGSKNSPCLVVLDYHPKNSSLSPIVLVGKGITYDTGGINLKPFQYMKDMKQDMAGAAAVFGALQAIAMLKLPVHVIGITPLAENMPGSNSTKPGDVYKAYNGKTVEIMHSDAEGRVILGDALAYAEKKYRPQAIIEASTLTGAAMTALGRYFSALFCDNKKLRKKIIQAGKTTGERVWPLPLVPEMFESIKSEVADIQNIGKTEGEAGAQMGAAFLQKFVEKTPFAHLDIAPSAFLKDVDSTRPYLKKGATGFGVRLFVNLLQNWNKNQ